uniref:hypothetical protein n=1 Tax=Acetatifactor sp. TaxID=1872090 RepID=UPI004056AD27
MYRIGMDGGGTRLVVLEQEQECFCCETGGINYNSYPSEVIRSNLSEALTKVQKQGYSDILSMMQAVGILSEGIFWRRL